jgi:hypothetical protein
LAAKSISAEFWYRILQYFRPSSSRTASLGARHVAADGYGQETHRALLRHLRMIPGFAACALAAILCAEASDHLAKQSPAADGFKRGSIEPPCHQKIDGDRGTRGLSTVKLLPARATAELRRLASRSERVTTFQASPRNVPRPGAGLALQRNAREAAQGVKCRVVAFLTVQPHGPRRRARGVLSHAAMRCLGDDNGARGASTIAFSAAKHSLRSQRLTFGETRTGLGYRTPRPR